MSLPTSPFLHTRLDAASGVLQLTLNRPEARNALNPEMVAALVAMFQHLQQRSDVRVVVLRGAGGHFCAGADLKGVFGDASKPAPSEGPDPVAEVNLSFGRLLRQAEALPQVLITICEGGVLGGGFGLACVSDIAFAHVDTKFGMPETSRGLPPAQIAPFVVARIGMTQARRLVLTSAQFNGIEALRLGLVHDTFASEAELGDKLSTSVNQVLRCGPQANARTKDILRHVGKLDADEVLTFAAKAFADCVRGPEAPEGIGAFLQKRPPSWGVTLTPADFKLTAQEPSA